MSALSGQIIGCAIEVHRRLGPGLLESIYHEALCLEFEVAKLRFERNLPVVITYRERNLATPLRLDLIVCNEIIVEIKSVEEIHPVHEAQLLSYLRLANKDVGLLINFNVPVLKDGVRRKVRYFPPPPSP